jgi:hypothetical protein
MKWQRKVSRSFHTALVDSRSAYELALKDTDDEAVAGICKEMIFLRHSDHQELHQSLILTGEVPDEKGSFMSVVHETVVGVRAALTGIGKRSYRRSRAARKTSLANTMMPCVK